jgi:hypothetical protein
VCQLLDIIILCPKIYLDYFWCIKYQYINIYIKIGNEKGKRKGKEVSSASWAGGISAQPSAGTRSRVGRRPTSLAGGGTMRAHVLEGGGLMATAGEVHDGSPPGSRFCDDGAVVRHGRG